MSQPGRDFDEFVGAHAAALLRTAHVVTGEPRAAEDLLQDVLERMFMVWPRVDDPLAYARRALVNAGRNRWRARSRRPEVPLNDGHDLPVMDGRAEHAQRDLLLRAVRHLPPRQRAVVVLRFLEDLSERETADLLGCSVGTVKAQTSRALAKLRQLIPDEERPAILRSTT